MFAVAVNTRRAVVGTKELITTGSAGIQVQFGFSEDWDDLSKFAVFRNGEDPDTGVTVALDANNKVALPAQNCAAEYVDEAVFCGVYGTDGLGAVIIPTIWASLGVLREGVSYEGVTPAEPTPDMWAQMLAIANSVGQDAEAAAEAAQAAAESARDGAVTAKNTSEAEALKSEGYAVGKQGGQDVGTSSTYWHNNAKYYKEQAADSANNAANSEANASGSATAASGSASSAGTNALKAEGHAVGKQNGVDVASGSDYYHNNSKYYSEQAASSATTASTKAGEASGSATTASNKAGEASASALAASGSASSASTNALKAEGYAIGKQNGEDVSSGSDYYHANAKYYSEQAGTSATNAGTSETNASGSASSASTNALKAEGFAVGEQNGTAVASGSPYYHNNAEYYAGVAEAVLESIPEDYSELSGDVDSLKSATLITDSASGTIASFPDGADGMPVKTLTVGIEPVQTGSGDPSPSNVRPISGWTGANVYRTGKNLWGGETLRDDIKTAISGATIDTSEKTISFSAASAASKVFFSMPFKENTRYTLILYGLNTSTGKTATNFIIRYTDGTSTSNISFGTANTNSYAVVTSAAGKTIKNIGGLFSDGTTKLYYEECGLFEGVLTSSDFEPYVGTTIPISWQSTAGTVYGGTLTVNEDGSADLVSSMVEVDAGTLTWTKGSFGSPAYSAFTCDAISDKAANFNFICSQYKAVEKDRSTLLNCEIGVYHNSANYWKRFVIRDDNYANSDAATFKTAMSGVKIVYELATPASSIHISNVSQLTTLLGINNVWADCGDIDKLEYVADTKLYIQKLTQPTEDDMVANNNIASGTYFMVGNNLYLSTASIAVGDAIVPGTNCTATNLAEALNTINS